MGQDPDVDAWIGVAEFFQGGKKDTVEGDLAGCNGNDTGLQAFIPGNLLFPIGNMFKSNGNMGIQLLALRSKCNTVSLAYK